MGKQRYENRQRRNYTDLRDEIRCNHRSSTMTFFSGRVSKSNYRRTPHSHKCQHHQQRSGHAAHSRSNKRYPYPPVIRIPRPCSDARKDRQDEGTRSDNRGKDHKSKDRNHRTNNHDDPVREHPKKRSAERNRKHQDPNSSSNSDSNSNSNRERRSSLVPDSSKERRNPITLGWAALKHPLISCNPLAPFLPNFLEDNPPTPPLPPSHISTPPPPSEFEAYQNPERWENGQNNKRKNDETTCKRYKELKEKESDIWTYGEKHLDSSSHSKSKIDKTEQTNSSKFTSYKWVKNVLDIPEMYRINFGFPDESQIGSCPIALKFWYDENHSSQFKYYIRLYDDSGEWIKKPYILKEQIGLALPQTYDLKISEILEKISNCPYSKRVWLDLRDFDLFSDKMSGLLQPILSHITHFSFGGRLYRFSSSMIASFGEVEGISLFYYIINHLVNLEYLCIDDEMLWKLSSPLLPPEVRDKTLQKLHTVRFLSTSTSAYACAKLRIKMTGGYVMRILRVAPNIQRLYGISISIVKEMEQENSQSYPFAPVCLDNLVRSLTLKPEPSVLVKESFDTYFLRCLSVLHNQSPNWHHLEELDTRTFFYIKSHTQVQCIELMSKIIDLNKDTIKKVIVKPIRVSYSHLKFPPLPRCTTIHFEILRNFANIGSYFSPELNFKQVFPNVHSVEIWSTGLETAAPNGKSIEKTLFSRHFSEWAFEARLYLNRVKNLGLFRYCPISSAHNMAYLFRNVTVLTMDNTLTDVAKFLPCCFEEWPKLRQLILKINTDTRTGDFDEAFTGIKRNKLEELSKPPFSDLLAKIDDTDEETSERVQDIIDAYRTRRSISHLQDLHLLKLVLRSGAMLRVPAFTKLSVMYGFGRGNMPKLAVQIGFHHRVTTDDKIRMISALAPVLPYVGLER